MSYKLYLRVNYFDFTVQLPISSIEIMIQR